MQCLQYTQRMKHPSVLGKLVSQRHGFSSFKVTGQEFMMAFALRKASTYNQGICTRGILKLQAAPRILFSSFAQLLFQVNSSYPGYCAACYQTLI